MAKTVSTQEAVKIIAPKFGYLALKIRGTTPYMQARFSKKAQIMADMELGSAAKSKKVRKARDYDQDCEDATYYLEDGSYGIPAPAFRNAMISACRLVGAKMTLAKMSVFVEADGIDKHDYVPLIRLIGKRERSDMPARNANGSVDVRSRPIWPQWEATVRIQFDEAQFTAQDVVNLMMRVGCQVGIGEGRPDSRNSAGLGMGLFEIVND